MTEFNRSDRPPRSGPEMLIRRLKASQSIHCTVLSQSLWGVWTHWNGARSEPCYAEKKECPGCKRGLPKRWKGYLHVVDNMANSTMFLELTPSAAEKILAVLGEADSLRGNRMKVARLAGDKARLVVELMLPFKDVDSLPKSQDPYCTLKKLWGIEEKSPMEKRLEDLDKNQ